MRLTDIFGFGITVVIYDADGTSKVLDTIEEVEQEIEDRATKRQEREADNE